MSNHKYKETDKNRGFPSVRSLFEGIPESRKKDENIRITTNSDWMITVSYFGKEADRLVDAVASFRGIDEYRAASESLREILIKFLPPESIKGINVILASYPSPTKYELGFIYKEIEKETAGDTGKTISRFIEVLAEEVFPREVIDELFEDSDFENGSAFNGGIEGKKRKITIHFEIDSLIRISGKNYAIEGKMYSMPPDQPDKSLQRHLSRKMLEKYLVKRGCLYVLIGFSFIYNENTISDEKSRRFWKEYASITYNKKDLKREEWIRYLSNCPVPIDADSIGIAGSWAVHFTVIDSGIFTKSGKTPISSGEMEDKPILGKSAISGMIINTIKKHSKYFLKRIITKIRNNNSLNINICPNFNILKVHKMAGIIQKLEKELEDIKMNLERERKARLRAEAEAMRERAEAMRERAEAMRERAERLRTEARIAEMTGQMEKADDLRKEVKHMLRQAEELLLKVELILKDAEELNKKAERLKNTQKYNN